MSPHRYWRLALRFAEAALIALIVLAGRAGAESAAFHVALIGEQGKPANAAVVSAVEQAIAESCEPPCDSPTRITLLEPGDNGVLSNQPDWDLVVAIGSKSGSLLAKSTIDAPRLFTFLPKIAWEQLERCCPQSQHLHSAIIIDQPLQRQLDLIRLLDPSAKRIGVILGEVSARYRTQLERLAKANDLELHIAVVGTADELGTKLRRLVGESDILLALPDPLIYDRNTIYSILLTTYSARVPVVGYSDAMVKAGAAGAVHTSPQDTAAEIATVIQHFRETGVLSPAGYPGRFSVSVNQDVIRSLQLPRVTARGLQRRLKDVKP